MRERPIIYTAESIRAILVGRKTQTRRVIRNQPVATHGKTIDRFEFSEGYWWPTSRSGVQAAWEPQRYRCPYGVPGDRLWVKETTWRYIGSSVYHYSATEKPPTRSRHFDKQYPSIFMPRTASRITQTIARIRVEQVWNISIADCLAEGVPENAPLNDRGTGAIARDAYADIWDSIYAKRGYPWAANPWVWVLDTEVAR